MLLLSVTMLKKVTVKYHWCSLPSLQATKIFLNKDKVKRPNSSNKNNNQEILNPLRFYDQCFLFITPENITESLDFLCLLEV